MGNAFPTNAGSLRSEKVAKRQTHNQTQGKAQRIEGFVLILCCKFSSKANCSVVSELSLVEYLALNISILVAGDSSANFALQIFLNYKTFG